MGMAASQARFLQLTARRSNIEYEGQQINQQRLTLANESAGLFQRQLSLVVPTPPSSTDSKYSAPAYDYTDSVDGLKKSLSWIGTDAVDSADFPVGGITVSAATGAAATYTAAQLSGANANAATMTALCAALEIDQTKNSLGYTQVVRNLEITHSVYNTEGVATTITNKAPALLSFDNTNRLLSVTFLNSNISMMRDSSGDPRDSNQLTGGDLTYSSKFDQKAYNSDMNAYEYKKSVYDYEIERINTETSKIQQQDKSLELKMKQLDTEHNAVQTEMDAVQKVIQKNIEGTYKTFS